MRALVRIATSVAVALSGCGFPVDEFSAPSTKNDAALTTNQDSAAIVDAPTESATDTMTSSDACVCVRQQGGKCKEWSPVDCGK